MNLYHYKATGEFLSTSQLQLDPIDKQPLIPRNSTTLAPPDFKEGFARVFIGGAWEQVEDHRGETWYNKHSPRTITALGPLPAELTREPVEPTDEETLHALRLQRNRLLRDSDWMLLDDAPFSDVLIQKIKGYRQALRDLPDTITDLNNIEWPAPPF